MRSSIQENSLKHWRLLAAKTRRAYSCRRRYAAVIFGGDEAADDDDNDDDNKLYVPTNHGHNAWPSLPFCTE